MNHSHGGWRGVRFALIGLLAVASFVFSAARAGAEGAEKPAATGAPVDVQCPWGRLGDGRGHLVRCLTSEEATHLREPAPAAEAPKPPPMAAAVPAEPIGTAPAIWPLPPLKPPAETPPVPTPPAPAVEGEQLSAEIGPVVADSGTLSDARRTLRKAQDRITECAEKNGGVTGDRADVELRFLVQERGRAEGVSLKKRRGVSEAAAKCIADVVDRRFVGFPDEPAVGATLVVTISKKKK